MRAGGEGEAQTGVQSCSGCHALEALGGWSISALTDAYSRQGRMAAWREGNLTAVL